MDFRRVIYGLIVAALMAGAAAQDQPEPGVDNIPEGAVVRGEDEERDAEIRQSLLDVYKRFDDFRDIRVLVEAGVLTLRGQVPSAKATTEAVALARRVEGVVYVRNRLEEPEQVRARLAPAVERFQDLGETAIRKLPVALIALIVLVVASWAGGWLSRREWLFRRFGLSNLGAALARRMIRTIAVLIGALIALEVLDATAVVGAVLGVAGVAGIALGFAFRNIVENYLAGILLSARHPFDIGDHIRVKEFEGLVVRLTSRDTQLMTLDGNHLRIPNSQIITFELINFSRNPLRRFEFMVGVDPSADLSAALDLGHRTLLQTPGVLADPAPISQVADLGPGVVQLRFFGWTNQRESDFGKVRSEAIRLTKEAIDRADFDRAEPTYRVKLSRAGAADTVPHPPAFASAPVRDVRADSSVDRQVAADLANSDEQNLLE